MKSIIFSILLSAAMLSFHPGISHAERHHRHYRVRHARVVYVHPYSRPHGVHANVGVGVGPIHIGAGAGVHEAAPPFAEPPNDDSPAAQDESYMAPAAMAPADIVMCSVTTAAVVETPVVVSKTDYVLSSNTDDDNVYYYTYVPPKTVTVGGFNVAVVDNSYYSPFKHRFGEPMRVHNSKGEDKTAGFGVSPRAGSLPTTFGVGYIVTAIPAQ